VKHSEVDVVVATPFRLTLHLGKGNMYLNEALGVHHSLGVDDGCGHDDHISQVF